LLLSQGCGTQARYARDANTGGAELTREQQGAHQAFNQRRPRIELVKSRVTRCRIVQDRSRLWKAGVRNLVLERC